MAAAGYWARKCARKGCGHRRDKHTARGACTMRTGKPTRLASGRKATTMRDCACTNFLETEG